MGKNRRWLLVRRPAGGALAIGLAGLGAAAISYGYLDRPLAVWIHRHLAANPLFPWLTHIVDPLVPLALCALVIAAATGAFGCRLGQGVRPVLGAAIAVLVAAAVKDELKWVFGRTWPETWIDGNPSYLRDGVYTFAWFHGGRGWSAFPSGHMTLLTAWLSALWRWHPAVRWIGVLAIPLVGAGLLGANYHWLSDVICGALLGAGIGLGIAAFVAGSPQPLAAGEESAP
ncbi:MAG: phosphatase PAP2 family protein [Nevskia sp.]|nr:phosphatase PAP2 family protein [Nevskia sp.]